MPYWQICKKFGTVKYVFFQIGDLRDSSTVDIMTWIHPLVLKKICSNSGPIGRYVRKLKLRYRFRQEIFFKTVKYVFCNLGSHKSFHCGLFALGTLPGSPKRISSKIGPLLQRCKKLEKLGTFCSKLSLYLQFKLTTFLKNLVILEAPTRFANSS